MPGLVPASKTYLLRSNVDGRDNKPGHDVSQGSHFSGRHDATRFA
jgi:hypothetical protein